MLLRRNGSKAAFADKIIKFFPSHKIYIEPFFGAGGLFFNKKKAQYNFLNDIDNDIFNLFMQVKNNREQLFSKLDQMPIHANLMNYWKKNEEEDPVWKAIRFLFISNFTYLSKGYNIKFTADNSKRILLENIEPTFEFIKDVKFMCCDFRDVLKNISFVDGSNLCKRSDSFIYSDGPYYGTEGWYTVNSNKEQDIIDHFDILTTSKIRFAMSEFDSEIIMDMASDRKLHVEKIIELRNLKNRRTEILIMNYRPQTNLFNL